MILGNRPALDLIQKYVHSPHNGNLEATKAKCYKEMKKCLWDLKINYEFPDNLDQLNLFLRRMKRTYNEPFVKFFFDKLQEIIDSFDVNNNNNDMIDPLKNEFFEEIDVELRMYQNQN